MRCQIIWAKNTFAWGFGRYKFQHEPIFYAHVAGQKDAWYGDKSQSTLWQEKKPAANRIHPTAKPIELVERALINSSKAGDIVVDLFGGSGSTLIGVRATRAQGTADGNRSEVRGMHSPQMAGVHRQGSRSGGEWAHLRSHRTGAPEEGGVTALCRRVRTLETNACATAWNNNFAEAQNLALNRMSSPEREVLKAVIAHAHDAPTIDFDGDLWRRWEAVFAVSGC